MINIFTIPFQLSRDSRRAVVRVFKINFIYSPNQVIFSGADGFGPVVTAGTADAEQLTLAAKGDLLICRFN